jgi:hypothetical protein
MHRFVWNLTWGSSGAPAADEEAESRNPPGPKAIPGIYEIRLTVDGQMQTQPLEITMDPRSAATPEILRQQFQLANQIFIEAMEARRVLSEINSVQKQIAEAQRKLGERSPEVKLALADVQSGIAEILKKKDANSVLSAGLQEAYQNLVSALRVVERGERATPAQAIALHKESSQQAKISIEEWTTFQQMKLAPLNQRLHQTGISPITISEIEQEGDSLMSH